MINKFVFNKNILINFYIINLFLIIMNYSNSTNYEFNNLVIFGDSISDGGRVGRESRYVAGGFDSKMYNDYLSEYFTGKKLIPFTHGGTNYAIANSKANSNKNWYSTSFPIVSDSINLYLSQNNGKIDPNNLYILFIGGNDVTNSVFKYYLDLVSGKSHNIRSNIFTVNDTQNEIAKNVQTLLNAGAKYVLVSNVFDGGLVPLNLIIPAFWLDTIFEGSTGSDHFSSFENLFGKILDKILRQMDHIPPSNNDHDGEIYLKNIITNILLIPPNIIGNFFLSNNKLTTHLTRQINYSTELELEKINGNIVYLDIYSLINEIIDNPKIYGIDDILLPTCTLGRSANRCNKGGSVYHDDKSYLWSDWFHPSPQTHEILANYIISVFNAPLYISAISKQIENNNDIAKNFLNNKLLYLKNNNNYSNKINTFINYSGSKDKKIFSFNDYAKKLFINNLNLGITYQVTKKLLLGSMLTISIGKNSPYKNFKYSYNNEIINLFTQLYLKNNFWSNLNLHFAIIKANNIKRSFPILKNIRTETGSTKGYNKGIDLNLGYNFNLINENILLTPISGISWDNYKVDGYKENNQNSTSMKFTNQSRNKSVIKFGINLNTKNYPINSYVNIDYNYAIKNNLIIINSSIKNTKTSFNREINPEMKKWLNFQIGFNNKINKNTNFNASLGYKNNSNKNNQLYYFTGFNIIF